MVEWSPEQTRKVGRETAELVAHLVRGGHRVYFMVPTLEQVNIERIDNTPHGMLLMEPTHLRSNAGRTQG